MNIRFLGRAVRLLLSIILVALFAMLVSATIFGWALTTSLTSADAYHDLIEETRLGDRTAGLIAASFFSYLLTTDDGTFSLNIDLQDWEAATKLVLPDGWLAARLHETVDTTFTWLESDDESLPQFKLSLNPVIQALRGQQGAAAVLPLLEKIRPCRSDENDLYILRDNLVSCLPVNQDLTGIAQAVSLALADRLPAEVSVRDLYQQGRLGNEAIYTFNRIQAGREVVAVWVRFSMAVTLLILCLWCLLYSSAPARVLGTLRIPLLVASGLSLLLWLGLNLFVQFGLDPFITTRLPYLQAEHQSLVVDLLKAINHSITWRWLVSSLILLGLALAAHLLFIGYKRYASRPGRESVQSLQARQRIRRQFR
jgi:hypothetical protein